MAIKMIQQVKRLAVKTGDLSSIPRIHMIKRRELTLAKYVNLDSYTHIPLWHMPCTNK